MRRRGSRNKGEDSEWKVPCLEDKVPLWASPEKIPWPGKWVMWEKGTWGGGLSWLENILINFYFWLQVQMVKCKTQTKQRHANGLCALLVQPTQKRPAQEVARKVMGGAWSPQLSHLSDSPVPPGSLGNQIFTTVSEHFCYCGTDLSSFKCSWESARGLSSFHNIWGSVAMVSTLTRIQD